MKNATKTCLSAAMLLCLLMGGAIVQAEMTRSTVEIEGIEKIYLLGPFRLEVRQGEEEYVTVIADSDHIAEAEARIKGNTLVLGRKRDSFWDWFGARRDRDVTFEVQVKNLTYLANRGSGAVELGSMDSTGELELSVQGSGKIAAQSLAVAELQLNIMGSGATLVDRVEAEDVAVRIHGSGDVDIGELYARRLETGDRGLSELTFSGHGAGDISIADGEADQLDVAVSGTGDVNAENLRAREARVRINGSGNVGVNVDEALDARINGSGDVFYRGQPAKVQRSINGSGNVQPR